MPIACRNCGADNPDRARFCLNCATPILHEDVHEDPESVPGLLGHEWMSREALSLRLRLGEGLHSDHLRPSG